MTKEVGPRDYAACLGKAFAAGVAVHNTLRKNGAPNGDAAATEAIIGTAKHLLDAEIKAWEAMGLAFAADTELNSLQRVTTRLENALRKYILKDPLPKGWEIVAVEDDLGEEAGHARPDLIVRDESGLAGYDYKCRTRLPAEWRMKAINEFAQSNQMLHYSHFVSKKYGEPVSRYYIGLAVLEPSFHFDSLPFPVHEESLKMWYAGAERVWKLMEEEDAGLVEPFMAAEHSDKFGRCEFYKACFEHHYDPYLMLRDYHHVPKPEEIKLEGDD
jgi:hypothetical protein